MKDECEKRKKLEPFRCSFVPESAIVSFILMAPQTFEEVFKLRERYIWSLRNEMKPKWDYYRKIYHCSGVTRSLCAMVKLKFNYMDSTIATRDFLTRFMVIYGKHRDKIQGRIKSVNA